MTWVTKISSSDDGHIYKSDASYATAHDAASGTVVSSAQYVEVGQFLSGTYSVERGVFYFDTSAIPAGSEIVSAKLRIYNTTGGANAETYRVQKVSFSDKPPSAADYDKANWSGDYGAVAITGTGSWHEIPLTNPSLLVICGGTTILGLRCDHDINNSSSATAYWIGINAGENSTNPPELVIEYNAPFNAGAGLELRKVFVYDWFHEPDAGASADSRYWKKGAAGTWRIQSDTYEQTDTGVNNAYAYHTKSHDLGMSLRCEFKLYFKSASRRGGFYFLHSSSSSPHNNGNGYGVRQVDDTLYISEVASGSQTNRANTTFAVSNGDTVYYYVKASSGDSCVIEVRASKTSMAAAKALSSPTVTWTDSSPLTSGSYFHLWTDVADVRFDDIKVYWDDEHSIIDCMCHYILTIGSSTFNVALPEKEDGTLLYDIRDMIAIYAYDLSDSEIQIFDGYIEEIRQSPRAGGIVTLIGRDFRGELLDRLVSHEFETTSTKTILEYIVNNYSEHLTPQVDAAATNISRYFKERNAYEAILDVAEEAGFTVVASLERQLIITATYSDMSGAYSLSDEIAGGVAITGEHPVSMNQLVNKVKVFGQSGAPQITYTSEDTTSEGSYGIREMLIVDRRLEANADAQRRADYFVNKYKNKVMHLNYDVFGWEGVFPGVLINVTLSTLGITLSKWLILEKVYTFDTGISTLELVRQEGGQTYEIHRIDYDKVMKRASERASRLEAHGVD